MNAIEEINKRRKAGGYYLSQAELATAIAERWRRALRRASLEAFEGQFDEVALAQKIDAAQVQSEALHLILRSG